MGWRDAQAKVDSGAYREKSNPFGEFAQGFANVFVPTYTKIQEEKRAEERKAREEQARRAAAAAAAARAENKAEQERQQQTDFILMQLGFSDPSQASDSIRGQVYAGVRNIGASSTADMLLERFKDGLPESAFSTGSAPEPTTTAADTQTDDILSTDIQPGSVGTNVGSNVNTSVEAGTSTLDEMAATVDETSMEPLQPGDVAEEQPTVSVSTRSANVDAQTAEGFSLWGPQPRRIDLNEFIGKSTEEIDDWIRINGSKYGEDQIAALTDYREIQQGRENDDLWWRDPNEVDNLSDQGLDYAIASAPEGSAERAALEQAKSFRVDGINLDVLRGQSVAEFDQFQEQYADRIDAEGLRGTFDRMRSIQQAVEDDAASAQVVNAKDIFLRSRMAEDNYDSLDTAEQGQKMVQYEREWAEGTAKASNESYTQANFNADYIRYAEIIYRFGLGGEDMPSEEEIAEARHWMSVTKPIAEERLSADTTAAMDARVAQMVEMGIDETFARKIVLGVIDIRTDPTTRESFAFDLTTGTVVQGAVPAGTTASALTAIQAPSDFEVSQLPADEQVPLQQVSDAEQEEMFNTLDGFAGQLSQIDLTKPMGIAGAIRRTANSVFGALGIEISPETNQATAALDMLGILTETSLGAAIPDSRDSVYLKQRLLKLTPQYGITQTPEGVMRTAENMISFLDETLVDMEHVANGSAGAQPSAVSDARVAIPRLQKIRGYYEALRDNLATNSVPAPSGSNYLGVVPEPPVAAPQQTATDTQQPAETTLQGSGTQDDPYVITPQTDPDMVPSRAFYTDPNGVLRQKR